MKRSNEAARRVSNAEIYIYLVIHTFIGLSRRSTSISEQNMNDVDLKGGMFQP